MSYAAVLLVFASAATPVDTAPAPVDTTLASVDPLDKVKCVREDVTGSLVVSRKVCHTVREWRRINGDAQNETQRLTQTTGPLVPPY